MSNITGKVYTVEFSAVCSQLNNKGGTNFNIVKKGNLYNVPLRFVKLPKARFACKENFKARKMVKKRSSHLNERSTRLTVPNLDKNNFFCRTCAAGKFLEKQAPREAVVEAKKMDKVYSDVMGPIEPASINGFRNLIRFIGE